MVAEEARSLPRWLLLVDARVVLAVDALTLAEGPLDAVLPAELAVALPLAALVESLDPLEMALPPDPLVLEVLVEAEPLPSELELLDVGSAASGLRQLSQGPYASPLS